VSQPILRRRHDDLEVVISVEKVVLVEVIIQRHVETLLA
jgi:hypothetical protein